MGMESERFFDLVRWGEAERVLNKYYAEEANDCSIYSSAHFTKNKNEYLPIPYAQIAASNGHYKQKYWSVVKYENKYNNNIHCTYCFLCIR